MIFLTKLNRVSIVNSTQIISKTETSFQGTQKPLADLDLVRSYLRDIGRVPLLTNEQEITLGRQVQELMVLENLQRELESIHGEKLTSEDLAKNADITVEELKKRFKRGTRAKERMVAANLRLVVSVAKKYTKRNMELLDLIQEGTIGLVRGVEKFDPARGYKFSTYAYWWIRQGITRAIAEKSRLIRLPIHITEVLNKLKKGQRELSQQLARTPSLQELADYVEISVSEVKELMFRASQPVSLETKISNAEDTILLDLLSTKNDLPQQVIETDCMKCDLEMLLGKLPELQNRVLRMRYGINGEAPMTLTGIGRILGISRDRVRNLERDGLKGLRKYGNEVEAYVAS
ncbi:RpoD/SigA family RNA polymerase sigma factor [Prochlorococcus marinus]|uniref:RpoD/SigA family RNA polymerase sigma factor n=1 Tax=Prochlorococcus marinus TaxID=1219 RepID=UPI0022B39F43|nr:RpoD/SigA family RNA polymerase sigma factor [Prochlorococcus marinus]